MTSGSAAFPHPSPHSLLGRYLTPGLWEALKTVRTRDGVSLEDCIRSGLTQADSAIGIYAGDAQSVETFDALFAPVVGTLHAGVPGPGDVDHGVHALGAALPNPDPGGTCIRSTRIRLARNLQGHAFMPTISHAALLDVEVQVRAAMQGLEDASAYAYYPVGHARANATGFNGADRFQLAAGMCRDWPIARGLYANGDNSVQVWVNEEDHLRIVAMQPGADVDAVFKRLLQVYAELARSLRFAQSARYGYLSACPSNLGTGMRASFHMHLPHSGESAAFKRLCEQHGLAVRGAAGERSTPAHAVYDISNRRRLGVSVAQCLSDVLAGVAQIVALEQRQA